MKKITLFFLFLIQITALTPCTTAVITGRASKDGRPLLYKQRDSSFLNNKVMLFTDGLYTYTGIVNSEDKEGKEVWGGFNSTGFAIMNSASYNLNPKMGGEKPELEGVVMKLALQKCKTLKDFENLLDTLPRPMNLSANFGVIDAYGGAAYYETGDYRYIKFDANESKDGYLLRTNFSVSGDREEDLGLSRCKTATELFKKEFGQNNLSYKTIFQDISRSLKHGITEVDLHNEKPKNGNKSTFVAFRDFIPRYSTTASIVVQGVLENESPELTTMWTLVGSPLTSVSIPILITPENDLPIIVLTDETGKAPLCEWSLELKKTLFPITRGEGKDYLNLSQLITQQNDGIMQRTTQWENEVFVQSEKYLSQWHKEGKIGNNYKDLNKWITQFLTEEYTTELKNRSSQVPFDY